MSSKGGAAEAAAPAGERSQGPQLGNLQKVLLERVDMLTRALEQKAITDFNDWLVCAQQLLGIMAISPALTTFAQRANCVWQIALLRIGFRCWRLKFAKNLSGYALLQVHSCTRSSDSTHHPIRQCSAGRNKVCAHR
jgi:hypothetical protein